MKRVSLTRQRGITMVVVLLLMTVMLLGGLALARITESSVLVSGNVAVKEASVQASEVGLNTAQAALVALVNENANSGTWYSATMLAVDANGIPVVDWSTTPTVNVGRFTVTYAVDRMCTVAVLVNSDRECLVKMKAADASLPANYGHDAGDHYLARSRQFRVTVRVTETGGGKGTQTWMQTLASRF
jgi:Tfp pilus assembly protein PilX